MSSSNKIDIFKQLFKKKDKANQSKDILDFEMKQILGQGAFGKVFSD
jgi:hypothetical protein